MTNETTDNAAAESETAVNFENASFGPPPLADPDDPFRVKRSHLEKMDPGKSSNSCKVSMVTRFHRSAVLKEIWCASFEEASVYENLAAHPEVINLEEQLTRVDFVNLNGEKTHTRVDATVLLKDASEVLFSVKYDEKSRRTSYLAEIANVARQCSSNVADRFVVGSRYAFHPIYRKCAEQIHLARRGWDPEADRIVCDAAFDLGDEFTFASLIERTQLSHRGWRAAVRVIADGDIQKDLLAPFAENTVCRRAV
jgi:hypothetical protein